MAEGNIQDWVKYAWQMSFEITLNFEFGEK